jgi:hypothetical protein
MRNDINGLFYNPAIIASIGSPLVVANSEGDSTQTTANVSAHFPQSSFGYTKNLLDINSGYLAVVDQFAGIGTIAIGLTFTDYGTFDETDALANTLGTFGASDLSLNLSYASEFEENLLFGIAGKFIYSSIASARSAALAVDCGALYLFPGKNPVSIGASILNLGRQINPYVSTREDLPLEIKIGVTIKPQHLPLLLSLNFHRLNESRDEFIQHFRAFSLGGEFILSKPLRFRFGYHNERRKELKIGSSAGMAGFSTGIGIVFRNIQVDYSYTSYGKIGSLNRVGVGMEL